MTGVGQYTLQLARSLLALDSLDIAFFDGAHSSRELRSDPSAARGTARSWVRRLVPGAYEIKRMLEQRSFGRAATGYDVYHEPATLALAFPGATVVTVHDLSWIRHPETHPPERVRALERHFEPALRGAARVITGAAFIKQEIMQVFGLPGTLIDVIPHGRDPAFRPLPADETSRVLGPAGLVHGGYFLCVGTLEPRKNLVLAIQAHALLPAALRARHPLVVAGMKGWGDSAVGKQLSAKVAAGDVRLMGYLERGDLVRLTAGALAMVYPSLYEGFGFPPLEAMACGVPAVTSNTSSLPEVVGDAGLMVDPSDVEGLSAAMRELAQDPGRRGDLSARSLSRAQGFSWERCALATQATYRKAFPVGAPA
ncbi:glycosyltransferase family 1 protein [Ramlibacter sp. WS9]|nr:glycosyltransferase family 1 protein [Ramlibacter sp. WS9]